MGVRDLRGEGVAIAEQARGGGGGADWRSGVHGGSSRGAGGSDAEQQTIRRSCNWNLQAAGDPRRLRVFVFNTGAGRVSGRVRTPPVGDRLRSGILI
jgi:hypothetical protein